MISVVVATHNRRELLRRCLDSLAAQTQDPVTFEVIVADDGSGDGTAEMAEELLTPFRLRVLRLDKCGKPAALNAAIEAAAGRVCLFLDDDIVASPGMVGGHLAAHAEEPKALAVGALTQAPPTRRDWFARAYANAWNERYAELARRDLDWPDCYGGNFSAPREALLEVGGFATGLAAVEDIELGYRLCQVGCAVRYLPRAHGVHDDEKSRGRRLEDTRSFGAFSSWFAERHPATRPKLLGWFFETTRREAMLRRLLLALRASPRALAALGAPIPGAGRRQIWFGFVSRYTFWLGARSGMSRAQWRGTLRGVPVLMYHAFTNSGESDRYVLPGRSFARQMRLLAALRYRMITFEDLARALREGRPPPPRSAVLTIDDGYADNLEIAQPILSRRRFPATLFLVSTRLGGENDWDGEGTVAGRPLLSIEQVAQMRAAGTRAGAHTRSHCSLPAIADETVAAEIGGSREELEAALGEPVTTFAYPYGRFDRRAVAAADRAGFLGACTVEGRPARLGDDPLLIPRIEIRGSDSILRFLRRLWLGSR